MKMLELHLVWHVVGDVDKEIPPSNFVEHQLVLCTHDKSTSQANNAPEKSWVSRDMYPLKERCRLWLHQSNAICSTVGWLVDVSQTLKYGKKYDNYWTGELFVKQVNKFSQLMCMHGPGYQALIMVNFQGHSAYAEDALLVSWMNVRSWKTSSHTQWMVYVRWSKSLSTHCKDPSHFLFSWLCLLLFTKSFLASYCHIRCT